MDFGKGAEQRIQGSESDAETLELTKLRIAVHFNVEAESGSRLQKLPTLQNPEVKDPATSEQIQRAAEAHWYSVAHWACITCPQHRIWAPSIMSPDAACAQAPLTPSPRS